MGQYGHKFDSLIESRNRETRQQMLEEGAGGFLKRLFSSKKSKNESKTVYACGLKGSKSSNGARNSESDALKFWICSVYNGNLDKGVVTFARDSYYKSLEKDNQELSISKFKQEKDSNGSDKYTFIETIAEDTVINLIKKYSIKIDVKDNSAIIKKRTKIYKDACSIASKIILDLSKEDPQVKKGFTVNKVSNDDDNFISFVDNIDNDMEIISCDAWAYTNNKARDEEEYNKYIKAFNNIYNELKKQITFASVDYYGDWDDGPICIVDNK